MSNFIDQNSEAYLKAQLDADYQRSLVPNIQPSQEFSWDALTPTQPQKSAYEMAVENADTYNAYMENMLHQDPNAYRRNQLAIANERAIQRLAGKKQDQQEWIDSMRSRGIDDNTIQEKIAKDSYLSGLSGSERLRNYLNRQQGDTSTFDDPDFEQDLISKDIQYLEATYGKEVANYAFQEQKERFGLIKDATRAGGTDGRDIFSWDTLQDAGASVLTSVARTAGGMQDAISLATGLQSVEEVVNEESIWDSLTERANNLHTDAYKISEQKNQAKEALRDANKEYDIQQEMSLGYTRDRAESRVKFNNSMEAIKDLFREDGNLLAQAAETVGDLAFGGIVAKGSAMLARGVSEDVVKSYVLKELQSEAKAVGVKASKEAQDKAISDLVQARLKSTAEQQKTLTGSIQGTSHKVRPQMEAIQSKAKSDIEKSALAQQEIKGVGKTAERKAFNEGKDKARQKAEEIISSFENTVATGAVTIHGGNQEAIESLKSGYQLVADMEDTRFANTTKGQEITQSLNEKYGVSSLEEGLANKEYAKEFKAQKEEIATQAAKEAYKRTFVVSGALNLASSGLEKRIGNVSNRAKSFKEHLKNFIGDTTKETVEEAYESAVGEYTPKQTANEALGSEVFDPNEKVLQSAVQGAVTAGIGSAGMSALPLGKSGTKSITKKVLSDVAEKQQTKLNQESDNEINSIYGNPTVDTRSTVQKVKDKVTGTTKPSESEVKTTGVFGKKFSETNFGKTWNELSPEDENVKKLIDENKSSYTGTVLKLRQREQEIVNEFQQAQANKDTATATKLEKEWNSIQTTLNSLKESLQKDVMSGNPEVSKKLEQINSLVQNQASEEEINKVWDEIDSIQANDKELTKLTESNLYKLLSDNPSSIEDSERITSEDILGNPNYSVPNYGKFNSETNKKLTNMEDLVKAKDSKTIKALPTTLAKIFTEFSVVNQKNNTEPRKVLNDATKLLNRAEFLLNNSGVSNPKLRQAIAGFREAIQIANATKQKNNPVFKEIYFGSMKNGKYSFGLMDYLADSLRNNGELSLPMRSNLVKFNLSQLAKIQGLNKALEHFNSSSEPVNLENLALRSKSKLTQSLSGSKVTLRSKSAVENYKKKVITDLNAFRSITNALLNPSSKDTVIDPDIPSQIKDTSKISSKEQGKRRIAILEKVPNTQEEFDKVKDSLLEELMANGDNKDLATNFLNSAFNKKLNSSSNNNNNNNNINNNEDKNTTTTSPEVQPNVDNGLGTFADSSMPLTTRFEVSNPYIGDIVAKEFSQFTQWGNGKIGNELTEFDSEETDTIFEVNTSEGIQTYRLPMSAMVELHRKGFDPTVNLVEKITTEKELDTISKNFLDILKQDGTDLLGSMGLEESEANLAYAESFKENLQEVNKFFNEHIPVILNQGYKSKLSKFVLANGMLNFISIEEGKNGKPVVVIPPEVKVAFAKAVSFVKSDSSSLSFGKHSQFQDYFFEELGAADVAIFKATDVERYGEGFETKDFKAKREQVELSNYSELGITRNNFIQLLGEQVLDNLPLNINKGSEYYSEDIHNGLVQSLGIEAYNIMLQQGLLEVHYVDIIKKNPEQQGKLDTHTIPYVNFKTNISENLSDKEQLAYEAVSSGVDLDGMSVEQGQSFLEKNNKHLLNQAILVRYKSDELDSQIYNTENARNSGVFISSLSGRVGKQYKNRTETVKSSDTKNDITPTNNEKLVNAIGSMNTVTYALNQEYYGLLKTNPEALQLAFGYTHDIDNLPVTESTKKSLRSRNNDILRAIGLLKRFVAEAEAKGLSEEDIAFNFRHHFVTNMRTMLKADMNPQSNKIIREMLRLVQTEVNQDDGKIIGELKLEINLGITKSKFRSENGSPRTIEQLIKAAKGKRQSQDKNFAVGFLLALAQGLDLGKIEKTKNQDIFTMVQDWFNDTEDNFRKDAMEIVWKMQLGNETGTPYVLSKEEMDVMSKFGKEMGTAAPRALYALQSLANYMYRGTEKDSDKLRNKRGRNNFKTNLLLEADGIGNGLYNITKQFTLDFTEEYLNTIKRTGIIPLDILSQKYFQSKKKLKGDKLVEELQGSAGMFTKDSPDTQGLRDIYEVIADKLSKEANEAVQRIINSDYAKGKVSLSWKDFKFKLKDDNPNKQLIEDIKLLSQLSLTGHIKLNEDTKLEDIVFTPADVAISEDFLIEVKRNLSKAGVTPTVYGGQLEGIANQLTGDIKGQYIKMSDKLIQLASEINSMNHDSKEYKEAIAKLEAGINTLHNYNLVLGIPQSSLTKITDELSNKDVNVFELVKSNLDSNIFLYGVNSKNVKGSLKSGLASSLQKAIQDTYVGAFSMLNYSMSHDDVGFHNFIVEFQDKVKAKIEERNKEKGYAKNDPRNHSPLSKQEIREVIKTITSAPIIATAYSNSAELFEDVWELGNSLVKRGKYSVDEQTTLNSSYASVQRGGYQRNITTQLFRNYQKYVAAGASNSTSTTPSTESVTQTGLAQELLNRLTGITSLNVFDGIDGLLYFRDLLGQIANKITNQTHIETNLVKHFYNRFIKSGMVTLPETYAELSPEFKEKVNTMSLSKLLQQDFTNLNQKDIGYLLGVLTLTQMKLEASKLNPEYLSDSNKDVKQSILESIKLINAYKSRITEFRDNLLFNPKTTVNKLNLSELFNDDLAYTLDSSFSDKVRDNKGNYVDPNVGFAFGYNMNLLVQDFAYKVAQAEALRYIESKYLPSIINQFAGANRGYLFNEKELDSVGKRFYEFALTKFGSRINEVDFRTDSATLAEFLKSDTLIQSEYQTKLENTLKKMDIPSTNHSWITQNANENIDNYNNRLSKSEKQNSDKSLNEIYTIDEVISKYDYFADNTLSGRVFKTLTHNVKQLFGDNFRLSYDSEQIAKYLKDKGVPSKNISHAVNEMNTTDAGGFKWEFKNDKGELISFIFLNPRKKMTGHFLQNLLNHELLHANLHYLAGYMSNSSIRTNIDAKLGDNNPFKQSANRIKSIIDSMVQNSKHLSEVQELLQIYNSNPSDFYHYRYLKGKYNQVSVSLANYIFLSQMDGKPLPTGWNINDYSTALEGTIHELLAYSLGNPDSLLELANRKEARDLSIWEKVKEFFSKARQELLKVLGLEDKDLKESNLNGLLESLVNVNTIDSDISKTITSLKDTSWMEARTYRRNSRSSNESFSPLQSMYLNDHEKHLQDLTNIFSDNIGEVFKQVNGELAHGEEAIIASKSLKDTELNNFIKDLRNAGLSMNQEEEKVFKLAYASNVVNFETGSNSDLLRETTKVMQDILNNTDFSPLHTKVTNLLFKNNFNQNALLLAMFSTNKQLKDIIDTKVKSNSKLDKALKNLETKLNDWTIFKEVPVTGSNNVIDKLQHSAMLFSFRNKQSQQEKDRILRNEMAKAEALVQQNEWLDGLLAEFPNGLAKYLSISKDALTGRDLFQDGSGADSSIGQLIRLVVRNNEKLYGRNTLFSKGLSWIIGQDTSTQYSAKFKGESQQLTSVIRERLASVIPHSIRKQFENDLTKRDEEALDNVLITSELHRIADINSNGMKPELILKDTRYRQQAISDVWNDLNQELDSKFTGSKRKEIENFLRWQTQGLGELMVTRTAKSNNANISHEILPNGKAIAAFAGTKWSVAPDKINSIIRGKVEQLVTLYSLEYQNQDDLNVIADLFTNNSAGMKALVDTLKSLDNERNVHGNTVLGEDGYRYNKRNPNQDVKLMHPNSDKKDLIRFGYSHKATLPSGTEVWVTNDNINNRFTTGIFGLSDSSVKGVTMDGMNTLGSFTGSHSEARKYHFDKAIKDPNYYNKLKEKSSIKQTISANGKEIISEVEELPRELEKQFIDSYENGIDSIGNAKGRTMEEIATEQNNIYYIDQLNKHYHKSFDKSKFTKIDGNAVPKGKSQADKEFANRLNNIYNSLPEPTKVYIEKEGGLYIETTEIDNLLGYHKASITDVWTDKSGLPKPVQEVIKQVISIFSKFTGLSEPVIAKRSERLLTEVVHLGKDFILNRSGVVAFGNLASNVIHLWNTGIPLKQIPLLMKDGLQHIKQYNHSLNRLAELHHQNDITKEPKAKAKIEAEIKLLQESLDKSPVKPLVDEGILTSITLENERDEKEFDYIPQFQRKLGLDKFKETRFGKVWSNVMVQDGSTTHEFMEQALDLGDFVAKYALYTHLTKNRQFKHERAMNVIRDEFVNYGYNRGRVFDFLNQTGLTWFLSYKLGIQKIFFRNLRRNFLRTSAVYAGAKALDTNQVVPLQNLLLDGSLSYQLDPTNVYKSFGSHWLSLIL